MMRARVVRRVVRNTRGTDSSSTPTVYVTAPFGNHGADSYARYVSELPGKVYDRSPTPVAGKNPGRRTIERRRGMKEIARAAIRAVRSLRPTRYTTRAPRAGARRMVERIGKSRTIRITPGGGGSCPRSRRSFRRTAAGRGPQRR